MKKTLILITILITQCIFSQNGKVEYRVKSIKQDNLEHPMVIAVAQEYEIMNFVLNYNAKRSYFSIEKGIPYNKRWYNFAKIFAECYNDWYQNALTKEALYNQEIGNKLYQVVYNKMNDWIITEEIKIIEGYTCYKAVRKELNTKSRMPKNKHLTYIAWFTPEIPVPYGPVGNGGLPGLILQLKMPNVVSYTVQKITLNQKKLKVPLPREGKKINPVEKHKLMKQVRKYTED